jgi:hypothetical protein
MQDSREYPLIPSVYPNQIEGRFYERTCWRRGYLSADSPIREGAAIRIRELFKAYQDWCEENNEYVFEALTFSGICGILEQILNTDSIMMDSKETPECPADENAN